MTEKHNKIDRRNFLKNMGAAGLTAAFASDQVKAEPNAVAKKQEPQFPQVPRRKLGKTGVEVSCFALAHPWDLTENQIILNKALQWGINHWDTAAGYTGGKSELGIGKFLKNNPQVRKDVFIATKGIRSAKTADDYEKLLQTSLARMNTNYIDLYYAYQIETGEQLTEQLRQWAQSAKNRKLIRFFGFSTHKNMAKCLTAAAGLDWIDAIITKYNFRQMQDAEMQAAVQSCYEANIGLTAMKIQAKQLETAEDKKLAEHFLKKGFTEGQAKIKVVLEDKRISSVCVGVENVALLTEDVAAVLDKTKLSQADKQVFAEYARQTCSGYCAGCGQICDSALPGMPYLSDIMRYLMYYNSYGQHDRAKKLFTQIPQQIIDKLPAIDYTTVEARCPQHLPISKLVAEAVRKLA